jgi:hypothetical protein
MHWIVLTAALGVSACAVTADTSGICQGLVLPVASLRLALEAHDATPAAVGEAATDVVLGFEAGCRSR